MRPSTLKQFLGESETSDRAKSMGLSYMLVARWGKNGVSMYRQSHGELIPIKKNAHKGNPVVHDSDELMYLTNSLHHSEFQSIDPKEDSCLVLQVVHSVAMQLGISPKEILKQYYPKSEGGSLSLEKLFNGIQKKVTINGKKISLSVDTMKDIDDALDVVKTGVPVLAMTKTHGSLMTGELDDNGILQPNKTRGAAFDTFHAIMLVGVDKVHKHAIFRDSDHTYYGSKTADDGAHTPGFLKVDTEYLKKNKQAVTSYLKVGAAWK